MIWNLRLSRLARSGVVRRENVFCKAGKRREVVLSFIRSAKRSLLLSVFRCDSVDVVYELGEAAARGVDVQILITGRARGWRKRLTPLTCLLRNNGANVHTFGIETMKYHAKYMVADDRRALIGTLNLTRKCFRRTRDYVLVTEDAGTAGALKSLFWADVAGAPAPVLPDNLILGPEHSRERLESILAGANETVLIRDHKLSDPSILDILSERRRVGVSVLVDGGGSGREPREHGRLIVVDGKTAVLGSFSLTVKSLDHRRELGVVIRQPELAAKLAGEFDGVSVSNGQTVLVQLATRYTGILC